MSKKISYSMPLAMLALLVAASPAAAIDKCKVKVDKKTGVISVTAVGAAGPVLWGETEGAETQPFFNAATCVAGSTAKGCQLADPTTLAAKTPPSGCTLYLDDGSVACSAWIAGCTPKAAPVCGDGHADAGEACDGVDLNGKTCESQGFPYGGTLACGSCALDTTGCHATRFVDNGDGTVIDYQTGLQWEKKTGTTGTYSFCPGGPSCGNVHDVNNGYPWSGNSPYEKPDGSVFTDFLEMLNDPYTPFAGHSDWRLPTGQELLGIVEYGNPDAAINPIFGPTQPSYTWSSNSVAGSAGQAYSVEFYNGWVYNSSKTAGNYARGVRNLN